MDLPPLTLSILSLTPQTLYPADPDDPPPILPVPPPPASPTSRRPAPPPGFLLSPTHSYPSPFGMASLGASLSAHLSLRNTRQDGGDVLGVKMMLEVQGPAGRFRLGEVVHGMPTDAEEKQQSGQEKEVGGGGGGGGGEETPFDEGEKLPALGSGEAVELRGRTEIKELGLHVLIMSVAWETLDGRRTFQRFLKFNVNPPLSIKTRIHLPSHPSATLDPLKREEVYLEVLMQSTAPEAMLFDRVLLEPVQGLLARPIDSLQHAGKPPEDREAEGRSLMPGDTRQYLFLLWPSPSSPSDEGSSSSTSTKKSVFPPSHLPGTILPLGRLDVTWHSGAHRDPGRLQTSTLNRRVPVGPPKPVLPTRTLSAAPPSPGQGAVPRPPPKEREEGGGSKRWEYDLCVLDVGSDAGGGRKQVAVEEEFSVRLRVAVRDTTALPPASLQQAEGDGAEVDEELPSSSSSSRPGPIRLAIQHLTPAPLIPPPSVLPPPSARPDLLLSPPSRPSSTLPPTPQSSTMSPTLARPFSPLNPASRAMTPVSRELRSAVMGSISSPATQRLTSLLPAADDEPGAPKDAWPPLPYLSVSGGKGTSAAGGDGEVVHLGASLVVFPEVVEWEVVEENMGTTYADTDVGVARRYEAVSEVTLRFLALEQGLAGLGGLRVMQLEGEGEVGREWASLGDVWVHQ